MKQKLFRTVMAFFLAGAALTWVGCSDDYDEDIQKLNDRIDELTTGKLASIESQQASLQATLDNLSKADNALGQRISDLESQSATAADLKKLEEAQAALKAKIEALEGKVENAATQDWVTTTLEAYATTQMVGNIQAEIDALGKFDSEGAIQAAIDAARDQAVSTAGETMKATFQSSFDAAFAAALAGDPFNNAVAEKIAKALDKYNEDVAKAIKDAVDNEGVINVEIARQLAEATKDIKQFISGRVTSVQLIPELYIGGIETIELKTWAYKKCTVEQVAATDTAPATEKVKKDTVTLTTSKAATTVRYHVSPSFVQKKDIEKPSFVFENAETRAVVNDELVTVESYEIAGGVLSVDVLKNAKTSLTPAAGHIYTAALKVPIAEALLAEGETDAAVYSDYVRLTEATLTPVIAALTDKNPAANKPTENEFECTATTHYHFSEDFDAAKAAEPSMAGKIKGENAGINLSAMVTGCYEDGEAKEITKEDLKAAGLKFRFVVPKTKYEIGINKTNQQEYITISEKDGEWFATAKMPVLEDGSTVGEDNGYNAVDGKTPIVRVELIDTINVDADNNPAIADVRYFKVVWQKGDPEPKDLGVIKTFEYTLNCNNFIGEFAWNEMAVKILGALDMTYDEFKATYQGSNATISTDDGREVEDENGNDLVGDIESANNQAPVDVVTNQADVEVAHNFDADSESNTALAWKLTPKQIGTVIDKEGNLIEDSTKKRIKVTIPAKNPYNGKLSFTFEVKITLPTLPEINGYDATFWEENFTFAYIYPVQFGSPTAQETCVYNYELDRLFADSKIMKDMLPCGRWDLQFADEVVEDGEEKTQPEGYEVPFKEDGEPALAGDTRGYFLEKIDETDPDKKVAVRLNFNENMGDNWYAPEVPSNSTDTLFTAAAADITVTVDNNDAGKGILDSTATLKVWAALNDYNRFAKASFKVKFIKPLNITVNEINKPFVDQTIKGSWIECSDAVDIKDFLGYTVAEENGTGVAQYAKDLWTYYAVVAPVWKLDEAKTNLKKVGGNYIVNSDITIENLDDADLAKDRFGVGCLELRNNNQEIGFFNIEGVPVEKNVKLFIPVVIEHKWGSVKVYVEFNLVPNPNAAK